MSNTFGKLFRLTTYGESHGLSIGGIIDGCPAGIELDFDAIQHELDRRKPGQSAITTQRKESDVVQFHSGIFEGKTTGTPIGFLIPNQDQHSKDYNHLKNTFRPSHADYTYTSKYGIRDHRGGGRSSARETACRVVAGAIAKQFLAQKGISILSYVSRIGTIGLPVDYGNFTLEQVESNIVRCPDKATAESMIVAVEQAQKKGDSLGGKVSTMISGVIPGLGEPVFDKLHARLGYAMLGINAVKGFEIGSGFNGTRKFGSEQNDEFTNVDGKIRTKTNNSGGVQGGISNGERIEFSVGFKPTATIMKDQKSTDKEGNEIVIEGKGRHDPCVLPRAVPIVSAMAALVVADFLLLSRGNKL